MKISGSIFVAMAAVVILLAACQSRQHTKTADLAPNAHQVTAEEVIQTSMYTYVRVSSDGRDYWVAINKADIKEGETYYWSIGAEMNNFTSKELKRTFPSIFFIQDFTDQPITPHRVSPTTMPAQTVQPQQEFKALEVPRASGGVTIAELFSGRDKFAGKKVRISGQVVKFSPEIMNRNWV